MSLIKLTQKEYCPIYNGHSNFLEKNIRGSYCEISFNGENEVYYLFDDLQRKELSAKLHNLGKGCRDSSFNTISTRNSSVARSHRLNKNDHSVIQNSCKHSNLKKRDLVYPSGNFCKSTIDYSEHISCFQAEDLFSKSHLSWNYSRQNEENKSYDNIESFAEEMEPLSKRERLKLYHKMSREKIAPKFDGFIKSFVTRCKRSPESDISYILNDLDERIDSGLVKSRKIYSGDNEDIAYFNNKRRESNNKYKQFLFRYIH